VNKVSLGVLVGLLPLIAGSALAQVATPPPGPKPEKPAYVPTPVAPRPAPAANPAVNPAAVSNALARVPDLPYVPLELMPHELPLDLLAMTPNPLIGQSKANDLMPMLVGRRARQELVVMENLDFVLQIQDGMLEEISFSDIAKLTMITDKVKPLVPPKGISQEAFDRGMLSRVQHEFNLKIVREYQNRMNQSFTDQYGDQALSHFMKFLMTESIKEPMIALSGMLTESTWRMEEILAAAGIADTEAAKQMASITGTPETPEEERDMLVARIFEAWRPLSLEQKKAFLLAITTTRDDKYLPPIPMLNLNAEGARDRTNDPDMNMTVRTNRGTQEKKPD
jgi:hypothetical protein